MKTARQTQIPISWSVKSDIKVPSLNMLVNPSNLDTTYSTLITETRTLGGFVHEYWGEQLTTLSATGKTALFIDSEKGLTNKDSRSTESYQYFMTLLNIYKNNGKVYSSAFDTNATKANQTKIVGLGIVIMIFDNKQYEGYFETFSYTEDAMQPFNLEYSFTFKVMRILGQLEVVENGFI